MTASPSPAPARPLLVASIVACASFMTGLDSTAVVQALPHIAESVGAAAIELSLGVTGYITALAALTPLSGWFASRFGPRVVFCVTVLAFAAASVFCGAATDFVSFIAGRVAQGAAGALMFAVGRIAVLQTTERSRLVNAMNLIIGPGLVGTVLGPALGGMLTEFASWRWIFLINAPIGLVGVALAAAFMPASRAAEASRFDAAGFLYNAAALFCLLYGLDRVAAEPAVGAPLAALGLLIGVVAVRHAGRTERPLVSLAIMRFRTFRVVTLWGQFYRIGVAIPTFVWPLMFQLGLGLNVTISGALIVAHAFGDLSFKVVMAPLLRRYGFRSSMIWSSIAYSALTASSLLLTPQTSLPWLFALLFVSGAVRSVHLSCHDSLQYAELSPAQMGDGATLATLMMYVNRGMSIALAALLLGALATWRTGDATALTLDDFRVTVLVMSAISLISLYWYLRLPRDIGAEVSGHRAA